MNRLGLLVAAALLAACTGPAVTAKPAAPSSAPVVVAPTPVAPVVPPAPTPKPKPVVKPKEPKPAVKVLATKVYHTPVQVTPKPTHFVCYIGKPCNPPAKYWTKTVGCTVAWRKAMHTTVCPPGWPPIP